MINLALAIIPTFIIWLVTMLTQGMNLPFYTMFLIYTVSYLFIKETRYDLGDKL